MVHDGMCNACGCQVRRLLRGRRDGRTCVERGRPRGAAQRAGRGGADIS